MFEIQQVVESESKKQTEINNSTSSFAGVDIDARDKQLRDQMNSEVEEEEVPELTCKIKSITEQAEVHVLFSEKVE